MAYGDKISFGKIKDSDISYKKPSDKSFDQNWIKLYFENDNGWISTLEFESRKEWFKFVRKVNYANKIIKAKNIEKEIN